MTAELLLDYMPYLIGALALALNASWLQDEALEKILVPEELRKVVGSATRLANRVGQLFRLCVLNILAGGIQLMRGVLRHRGDTIGNQFIWLIAVSIGYFATLGLILFLLNGMWKGMERDVLNGRSTDLIVWKQRLNVGRTLTVLLIALTVAPVFVKVTTDLLLGVK